MKSIRKFLEPDWRKIVVFVFFGIISFTLGFSKYPIYDSPKIAYSYNYLPFLWPLVKYGYTGEPTALLIFLNSIYWYFLSCLIVWIWERRKKK
jgi:hypothetical protein